MSKFLPQKKKLLEEVYEKGTQEAVETSFTGIAKHIERSLKDDYNITLTYKSFETYYKSIVENEEDYNIKRAILDDLCKYIDYDSFLNYCLEWKTIEYAINHTVSKIVINITNKPVITWPSAVKNGFGIAEFAFIFLLLTGSVAFSNSKKDISGFGNVVRGIIGGKLDIDKKYMYWNGERYIATDENFIGPTYQSIAMDKDLFNHFKKITRPDTLTLGNSSRKVWCSKYNNEVNFFTMDGVNPDNNKELKLATDHMINTYGKGK
ncbi:hypothetical protein [Chryseobacterium sp. IT-36CA2]|uniref:hypothetical protein n=1 Tax=Chryseobacterium sp. IT-36CA2 TaxID=3026460 RepID=UPI0039E08922